MKQIIWQVKVHNSNSALMGNTKTMQQCRATVLNVELNNVKQMGGISLFGLNILCFIFKYLKKPITCIRLSYRNFSSLLWLLSPDDGLHKPKHAVRSNKH
jgi:hypothetical protein